MRALRTTTRVTATLTAAGVMALAAGPAFASDTTVVAQSEAEAISLSIAGNSVTDPLGGPYRAERTSSGETTEGENQPRANAITRQTAVSLGLLAQDAQTGLAGNRGVSEACSGVAGEGSSFVAIGDSNDCFRVGDQEAASLRLGQLDLQRLSDVRLIRGTPNLRDAIAALPGLGGPLGDAITGLNGQLRSIFRQIGNPGLVLEFDAIRSQCSAGPGDAADGSSRLAGLKANLVFPQNSPVENADILGPTRVEPEPNTELTTNFDEVVDSIIEALIAGLEKSDLFAGAPTDALEEARTQLRESLTSQIANELGPLDDVISGTLNKQERATGEIEVTAIDAAILPAVAEQTGFNLVDVAIARSQCGPGATLTDTPTTPTNPDSPDVPRVVPAGVGTPLDGVAARGNDATVPAALALLALMTFGSAIGFSTSRSRADA